MTHNHLSPTERYQIQAWLEQDLSKCQIALRLGRHRSTIYRELARCEGIYNAPQAQSHRSGCALRCAANAPRYTPAVWKHVRQAMMKSYWSPQQIAGRAQHKTSSVSACSSSEMPCMRPFCLGCPRVASAMIDLTACPPEWRSTGPVSLFGWARTVQPIYQRPAHVRQRLEVGHWETIPWLACAGATRPGC
jgi:IS30 family transposase